MNAPNISHAGRAIWEGKFFRAFSLDVSPMTNTYDVIVQQRHGDGWIDMPGGYNSLSNDYAYTNAREDAERRDRQCLRPEAPPLKVEEGTGR